MKNSNLDQFESEYVSDHEQAEQEFAEVASKSRPRLASSESRPVELIAETKMVSNQPSLLKSAHSARHFEANGGVEEVQLPLRPSEAYNPRGLAPLKQESHDTPSHVRSHFQGASSSYQRSSYSGLDQNNNPSTFECENAGSSSVKRAVKAEYGNDETPKENHFQQLVPVVENIVTYQKESSDEGSQGAHNQYQLISEKETQRRDNMFEVHEKFNLDGLRDYTEQPSASGVYSEGNEGQQYEEEYQAREGQLEQNLGTSNFGELLVHQSLEGNQAQSSSERNSYVIPQESKRSNLSHKKYNIRSSSTTSQGYTKGSSQLPVRQQNLYPQLSPQIIHSTQKGRIMQAFDPFEPEIKNSQTMGQHNTGVLSHSESLSRPAIINPNSNTKKSSVGMAYVSRASPNKFMSKPQSMLNHIVHEEEKDQQPSELYLQENPDRSGNQASSRSYHHETLPPLDREHVYEKNELRANPYGIHHQRCPSGNSALKTTMNYALSQTNYSQLHQGTQQTFLHEIDGLELTDDMVMAERSQQDDHHHQLQIQLNEHLDLSAIHQSVNKDMSESKDISSLQEQRRPDALRELENLEAELQAEVNQLDMIYEQHMQNSSLLFQSRDASKSNGYNSRQDYEMSENPQQVNQQHHYISKLDRIREESYDQHGNVFILPNTQTHHNFEAANAYLMQLSDDKRQSQEFEVREVALAKGSGHSDTQFLQSLSIKQYDLHHQTHRREEAQLEQSVNLDQPDEEDGKDDSSSSTRGTRDQLVSSDFKDVNFEFQVNLQHEYQEQMQQAATYIRLCEQRIRELQPGHPLPVLEQHLQQPNQSIVQLQGMLEKSMNEKLALQTQLDELKRHQNADRSKANTSTPTETRTQGGHQQSLSSRKNNNNTQSLEDYSLQLNQQYMSIQNSYDQLKGEKTQLEKALRRETQTSQELRVKLQILREQMEKRVISEAQNTPCNYNTLSAAFNDRPFSQPGTLATTLREGAYSTHMHASTRKLPRNSGSQLDATQVVDQIIKIGLLEHSNKLLQDEMQKLASALDTERQKRRTGASCTQAESARAPGAESEQLLSPNRELQACRQELAFLREQNSQLLATVHQLEEANRSSAMQLQQAQILKEALDRLKAEHARLNKQVSDLNSRNLRLESKLDENKNARENMMHSIKNGEERVTKYKEQIKNETSLSFTLQQQVDTLNLELMNLKKQRDLVENEKKMLRRQHSLEIDELKRLLEQNQHHMQEQEQASMDMKQRFEEHINMRTTINDSLSTRPGQTISQLSVNMQQKEAQAELLCLKSQLQAMEQKNQALLKKSQIQVNQIDNLKTQNAWLKDEREQVCRSNHDHKTKFEEETQLRMESVHQLELMRSQLKAETARFKSQTDKLESQNNDLTTKLTKLQTELRQKITTLATLEKQAKESSAQLVVKDKQIGVMKDNCQQQEYQINELRSENATLHQSENRIKRLLAEIDKLKELNMNLQKENTYSTKKVSNLSSEQEALEREVRVLKREVEELAEANKALEYTKKGKEQQILDQLNEIIKINQQLDGCKAELKSKESQANVSESRFDDLQAQIKKLNGYNDDLRQQLSRQIHKNSDNCMKFQQDQSLLENLVLQQKYAQNDLVRPFMSGLLQQIEASDILKESLLSGFQPNQEDDYNSCSASNRREAQNSLAVFRDQASSFIDFKPQKVESSDISSSDATHAQKHLLLTYLQFLQQDIIERLIGSLIETKSNFILQHKRQTFFEQSVDNLKCESREYCLQITQLEQEIRDLNESKKQMQEQLREGTSQQASLKQQLHNMASELKQTKKFNSEKEIQLTQLVEQNMNTTCLNQEQQAKLESLQKLEQRLKLGQLEKSYLWRALKSLKTFMKSDQAFNQLEDMLNEFIVLLEQLVVRSQSQTSSKKQRSGVYHTLELQDQQAINDLEEKLRVVEQDIKQHRIELQPTRDNHGQQMAARHLLSDISAIEKSVCQTHNFLSVTSQHPHRQPFTCLQEPANDKTRLHNTTLMSHHTTNRVAHRDDHEPETLDKLSYRQKVKQFSTNR